MPPVIPDKNKFITLTTMKMPFGKYKGLRLVGLPGPYLVWFSRKGFPGGKLGRLSMKSKEGKIFWNVQKDH